MSFQENTTNNPPNPTQFNKNRSLGLKIDNRAEQVRRDTDTLKNFTITIKNIDEVVFNHLQKMQIRVVDSGNNINVPIFYASPEKWVSVRKHGYLRDDNAKIILPALVFYRTSSELDKSMTTFNKYLRYPVIKKYSQKNQYTKFNLLQGKNVPLNEVYEVVMPDHMNFTYKFVIWTEYIEQMNSIVERINFETNDYWGTENGLKFRTSIDNYQHTTQVENDKDRLVKTEFDLILKGYLLPEQFSPGLKGFKPTTQKYFTKKKIIFGLEVVSNTWNPSVDESINDKWRSKNYPNITEEDEKSIKDVGLDFRDENI